MHYVLLICSFGFSIIYLLFNAGRSALIVFFACIVLAVLKKRGKNVVGIVVLGVIFILLFSASLRIFIVNVTEGVFPFKNINYSLNTNLYSTLTDYSFPYSNVIMIPQMLLEYGYRYCIDYFLWFYELIPKRLFNLPALTSVTSEVSQFYILNELSRAGTPADFITFGWFQGGGFGIIVNSIVVYTILQIFDRRLRVLSIRYAVLRYRMCFFAYSLITSNDIVQVVRSNLFLIIIMIVIGVSIKRSNIRNAG